MSSHEENLAIRPLILGAGGLTGRALESVLEVSYPHLVSASRAEIDLRDRWRLEAELERLEATVVINCAAMTDVDACEKDPELAREINADAPTQLALVCRSAGVRLIHLSTDYVFDGTVGREYDEADPVGPINRYGESKLLGERGVLDNLADAVVLRISFVFGTGRPTFIDKIAKQAVGGSGAIRVVDAWRSRPTYTHELARAIELILASDVTGIWHFANPAPGTRLEFARQVTEILGEDPARVVALDEAVLELAAPRPASTALSTRRFESRFGVRLRSWQACAQEYFLLHPPQRSDR